MPVFAVDASFNRNGYYIVTPESTKLSSCEFIELEKQPSLKEMQNLVGGYIECIALNTSPRTTGVVNEEGRLQNLPRNGLATILVDNDRTLIVGTMLVMCGRAILS